MLINTINYDEHYYGSLLKELQYSHGQSAQAGNGNAQAQMGEHIYTYDANGRMATSRVLKTDCTYTYDTLGNLVREKAGGKIIDYQYNVLNQLIRKQDGNDVTTFTYDLRGNLTAEQSKSKSQSYTFDATNHLVKGTDVSGNTSNYTYNALFKRVNNTQVSHSGKVYARDYVIDYNSIENNDLMVYASGEYIQRHLYNLNSGGHSERLMQMTDAAPGQNGNGGIERSLYVHEDVLGNTRYYTKDSGQSFAELQYDAWGSPLKPNKLINNDHGNFVAANYTGHPYDAVIDMYFAEARFYDADNRTWTSRDPIKDGLNWYKYVEGNPVSFIDSSGLEAVAVSGGKYYETDPWPYEFIEPALNKIWEWKANNQGEPITWLVAMAGWSENDLNDFKAAVNPTEGINVIGFTSSDQLINYLNSKDVGNGGLTDARTGDPVTKFALFSHGLVDNDGTVSLGFHFSNSEDLSLTKSQIGNLNSGAFASGNRSTFYSCNTGTSGESSFAQAWANKTGGTTYAFYGQSYYGDINARVSLEVRIARFLGGFYWGGSWDLPKAASDPVNGISPYMAVFSPN